MLQLRLGACKKSSGAGVSQLAATNSCVKLPLALRVYEFAT